MILIDFMKNIFKLKSVLRKKKIFNISTSFTLLIIFFISLIIYFGSHDLYTKRVQRVVTTHFEDVDNFYVQKELQEKVSQYRKNYSDQFGYSLDKFENYKTPSPTQIKIRVNRIYDFDEITSSFLASGTIEASWDESAVQQFDSEKGQNLVHENSMNDILSEMQLSFYNAEDQYFKRVNLTKTLNKNNQIQNYSKYKFKGRFRMDRDLRLFPFDSSYLAIRLTHNLKAPDIYLYPELESTMRDPLFRINAYYYVQEKCYNLPPEYDTKSYSCVYEEIEPLGSIDRRFQIMNGLNDDYMSAYQKLDYGPSIVIRGKIVRSVSSSFFRYLLPLIFGVLILTINNYINDKFIEIRIATPPTILLTFIFMQSGFHSEIPQISYVTFLDKIYLLCYFLASISMFSAVLCSTKRNKISKLIQKSSHINTNKLLNRTFIYSAIFGPIILYITP